MTMKRPAGNNQRKPRLPAGRQGLRACAPKRYSAQARISRIIPE